MASPTCLAVLLLSWIILVDMQGFSDDSRSSSGDVTTLPSRGDLTDDLTVTPTLRDHPSPTSDPGTLAPGNGNISGTNSSGSLQPSYLVDRRFQTNPNSQPDLTATTTLVTSLAADATEMTSQHVTDDGVKDVTSQPPTAEKESVEIRLPSVGTTDQRPRPDTAVVGHTHKEAVTNKPDGETWVRLPSDEEKLLQALFADYKPSARPVMNSSNTVNVNIQFSLMHIKDLDVRSQIFTTTGLLILDWVDERLTWPPTRYNNMTEIIIEANGLWRPEFAVINGAEKIYEEYEEFRAVISHEGHIHWEPGGVFKTMCEIDITYYPFDEQMCSMKFGAWSYHTGKMNLTSHGEEVNLDSYSINGEWEIYNTDVIRNEFSYENNPNEKFGFIDFQVFLRRRHTFYVLNVILPSIMTSVLLLSVFFCTPGQKVQIGVVVLLSFRIFLLNVADDIPKTSDHIPLLSVYLTCTMAITTLSMVLTVFVLNLHHITDRPVPPCLRRFAFLYLGRMLGMCSAGDVIIAERRRQRRTNRSADLFQRHSLVQENEKEERVAIMEMQATGVPNAKRNSTVVQETMYSNFAGSHGKDAEKEGGNEKDNPEEYAKDWKKLAEIFDRLFFWLFLMAITISTLVLFHPLTDAAIHRSRTKHEK